MRTRDFAQPEWIANYCVRKERLSDCVDRWEYSFQRECGYIYLCKPFPGVHLWMNDVRMHIIPTERSDEYRFIKLNYCAEGRSEVLLEDDRYVYLEKGILSVDSNAPKENFLFPGGSYKGLELVLNTGLLVRSPVAAFLECGIDPVQMEAELKAQNGSFLACVSREWRELAESVMERLKRAEGDIGDFRFLTLQLLYLLKKTGMTPVEKKFYLTRGQRAIVAKVEERLTDDLKSRYTVEELAAGQGVSPSSLKKYFEKVYGMSISDYIRRKRMEHACILLETTRLSVADVAAAVGYGNQGKFGSVFKQHTNSTPLEYRRLHRTSDVPEHAGQAEEGKEREG